MLKKARLVWLKKVQGVRQIARLKQQHFLSFVFYITQRSYEKITCIVIWLVQWWKLLYLHFLYTKDGRLWQIAKKHEWLSNRFSDFFTYCLNLKHFASLFFLAKDNFTFWIKSLFFSFKLRARLHETWSELKPLWNVVPFTWKFHCHNFSNNGKALLHMCKWYLLGYANLINLMQT